MRLFILIVFLAGLTMGCASTKNQTRVHEGPSTPIGAAPEGEEGRVAPPPPGPALMVEQGVRGGARSQETAEGQPLITRQQLEAFIAHGPAYAFSQVDTEPLHAAGAFVGFQVVDVTAEAHRYLAPHLRVGDVITHVNGIRLQRPDDYLQAWRGLSEASSVRIDYLRDGEGAHVIWQIR